MGQQNAPSPQLFGLPAQGPPTTFVNLQGLHFDPVTAIDIYFDSTHLASTTTDKTGSFGNGVVTANGATWTRLQIPSTALPGQHTITAKERVGQQSAQIAFLVRTDWPQYHFDVQHTGLNPFENVLSPATVGSLTLAWKYTMDSTFVARSSPVVANGVVYIGNYISDDNHSGALYALNATTGALVWKYTGGGITSSPAVANGVVYVGTWDQNVYAFNASTGALLWKYRTGYLVESSPAVANGVVYVGSDDHNLYALNATTGALLWKYSGTVGSPAVANGVVYIGSSGSLYALNVSTGAFLWKYTTNGGSETGPGTPAVVNGSVYFGADDGYFYALNASTGAPLWVDYLVYSLPPYGCADPAVANGVVYTDCWDKNDHFMYALDAATGGWRWQLGYAVNSPAVANGAIYVGSGDYLYVLDASTGALLWNYTTGGVVETVPAVVNGMVYIASDDGNVYAFGLPNQQMLGEFSARERPDPAPLKPDWDPPLKK